MSTRVQGIVCRPLGGKDSLEIASSDYPAYCVMRSPWEIFASCYRLHQWYRTLNPVPPQLLDGIDELRRLGRLEWPDWVRASIRTLHLCPLGGFSVRYAGPGVAVLQYEDRPYERLGEILGARLDMPRVNIVTARQSRNP